MESEINDAEGNENFIRLIVKYILELNQSFLMIRRLEKLTFFY